MQKLSFRKISILGLVLMAASAVMAAVMPNKNDKNAKLVNGSLTIHSSVDNAGDASSITCEVTADISNANQACTDTASTGTGAPSATTVSAGSSNGASSSYHGGLSDPNANAGASNTTDPVV